mmetsp:Transcript_68753/g.179107  ORF Transcript_68753/g.179107 Transcript_68753/m.179107 type:complete len:227 (+) Transcript_68753:424-1104(+)
MPMSGTSWILAGFGNGISVSLTSIVFSHGLGGSSISTFLKPSRSTSSCSMPSMAAWTWLSGLPSSQRHSATCVLSNFPAFVLSTWSNASLMSLSVRTSGSKCRKKLLDNGIPTQGTLCQKLGANFGPRINTLNSYRFGSLPWSFSRPLAMSTSDAPNFRSTAATSSLFSTPLRSLSISKNIFSTSQSAGSRKAFLVARSDQSIGVATKSPVVQSTCPSTGTSNTFS